MNDPVIERWTEAVEGKKYIMMLRFKVLVFLKN